MLKSIPVLISAVLIAMVCAIYIWLDRPLSEERIRHRFAEFLAQESNPRGLYHNHDSLDVGFRYDVNRDHEQLPPVSVIQEVRGQCIKAGWRVVAEDVHQIEFGRLGQGAVVVYDEKSDSVFIGIKAVEFLGTAQPISTWRRFFERMNDELK